MENSKAFLDRDVVAICEYITDYCQKHICSSPSLNIQNIRSFYTFLPELLVCLFGSPNAKYVFTRILSFHLNLCQLQRVFTDQLAKSPRFGLEEITQDSQPIFSILDEAQSVSRFFIRSFYRKSACNCPKKYDCFEKIDNSTISYRPMFEKCCQQEQLTYCQRSTATVQLPHRLPPQIQSIFVLQLLFSPTYYPTA